jgi:hypothetical protein
MRGSCDSALAISTRRFMPPDSVMILLSFLSHSDSRAAPSRCARVGRLAEQAAAEADRGPHRLEGVGRQLLRHQADQRARGAVVAHDVVAVDGHVPALGVTMPQTMLISVVLPAPLGPSSAKISPRAVGPEQGEDLGCRGRCTRSTKDTTTSPRLELDALRERRVLARFHVIGDAFNIFERAMLAPDLSRQAGHAAVGRQVFLRYGQDKSIDVFHVHSPLFTIDRLIYFSAVVFNAARLSSNFSPIILSMLQNSPNSFDI